MFKFEKNKVLNPVESTAIDLLKKHDLRITGSRICTLQVFLANDFALSQPDLEKDLGEEFDRVTIYRTLTSFLEKGLIHKVPDDAGATKYALCSAHCSKHEHKDEHIHFKCVSCANTHCLDELPFPHFKAPQGYTFLDTHILIQGVCRSCK